MVYLKLDMYKVNWRAFLWLWVCEQAHFLKAMNVLNSYFKMIWKSIKSIVGSEKTQKCLYYYVNLFLQHVQSLYIYIYIYIYIYTHTHTYIHTYIYTHTYTYIHVIKKNSLAQNLLNNKYLMGIFIVSWRYIVIG